jgi:hypothetical protein
MAEKILTLEEKINKKSSDKTVWDTPKESWENISIPEENALGEPHASIWNNKHEFKAGQTYLVPPAVAGDVRDRLRAYAKSCVRVLQPRRDVKSEMEVGGNRPSIRADVTA